MEIEQANVGQRTNDQKRCDANFAIQIIFALFQKNTLFLREASARGDIKDINAKGNAR